MIWNILNLSYQSILTFLKHKRHRIMLQWQLSRACHLGSFLWLLGIMLCLFFCNFCLWEYFTYIIRDFLLSFTILCLFRFMLCLLTQVCVDQQQYSLYAEAQTKGPLRALSLVSDPSMKISRYCSATVMKNVYLPQHWHFFSLKLGKYIF